MKKQFNLCLECGEERPDDDRVKIGMKCGFCTYNEKEADRDEVNYKVNIMTITIITDCKDDNALVRQKIRYANLFNTQIFSIGVANDIEASGNLIDCLDAYGECEGIIVVNVAPRSGSKNGSDFGYFRYKKILVVATIDDYCLSLIKKLDLISIIKLIKEDFKGQFRSYTDLPQIVYDLFFEVGNVRSKSILLKDVVKDIPEYVWWIDNFGNQKTTMLEVSKEKEHIFYETLADAPINYPCYVRGSSGIGDKRFIELVRKYEK